MKSNLIEEFISQLNIAKASKEGYRYDLNSFFEFLSDRYHSFDSEDQNTALKRLAGISSVDMNAFVRYLEKNLNLSDKTIARKISSVKNFYRYLNRHHGLGNFEVPDFRYSYDNSGIDNSVLTDEQIRSLIKYVTENEPDRNQAIIFLMLFDGITVRELINIKNGDVLKESIIIDRGGKSQRTVKINDALRAILSRFKNADDQLYLINGPSNGPISKRRVQAVVKNALREIGIDKKGVSTGILRNTSVRMIREYNDADFTDVKNFLGISTDAQVKKHMEDIREISQLDMNRNPFSRM